MVRRVPGFLESKAVPGFLQYSVAEGLSPRTLESYQHHLELWQQHIGDADASRVSTQ